MDPSQGAYDDAGNLICRTCAAAQSASAASATMQAGDPLSFRNLYGAAAASALMGVVTCCLSGLGTFFFVACPLAMFGGMATLYNLYQKGPERAQMGGGQYLVLAGASAGIAFGAIGTLLGLLAMIGAGLGLPTR